MQTGLKTFYVKSQRLAGFLMQRGFVLHGMNLDIDSNRNIFLFTNSKELLGAIETYKQMKELENKLNSMKLDMMGLETRLTGYRLENINMGLTLSNQITASSIKK